MVMVVEVLKKFLVRNVTACGVRVVVVVAILSMVLLCCVSEDNVLLETYNSPYLQFTHLGCIVISS